MEMEFFVEPGTDEEWHEYWIDARHALVHRPRHRPGRTSAGSSTRRRSSSHYSKRTVDIEYRFGFAGSEWGELEGVANRTDFDLTTHSKALGHRPAASSTRRKGERWMPYVIEPAAGLTRVADGVPRRRVHRGRGAEHQGRRRQAHGAAARPAPRAGQGRRAAAQPQRAAARRSPARSRPTCGSTGTSSSTTRAPSGAATAGRTRSARRSASRSTSTRSTTTPSPCASATRWSRSASASTG